MQKHSSNFPKDCDWSQNVEEAIRYVSFPAFPYFATKLLTNISAHWEKLFFFKFSYLLASSQCLVGLREWESIEAELARSQYVRVLYIRRDLRFFNTCQITLCYLGICKNMCPPDWNRTKFFLRFHFCVTDTGTVLKPTSNFEKIKAAVSIKSLKSVERTYKTWQRFQVWTTKKNWIIPFWIVFILLIRMKA